MHPIAQKPSLARLSARCSAILTGLLLAASVSFANAQTIPDIQRLMKQGQMPQALEKADQYIASKPKDAQGRFMKGLILTELGRPTEAIAIFTRLTEDFPELPEPYNNLAVLYAQQKQYDKARSALEMAIRTHPSYSIAHENLGDVYSKLASQAYDKALQLDSANKSTQTKLSMIKELISTSTAPGSKPSANAPKTESEPAKTATAAETPAKPSSSPTAAATQATVVTPVTPPAVKQVDKSPAAEASVKPKDSKDNDTKTSSSDGIEQDLTRLVQAWASAWSRKDVKSYLAFYAGNFQTPNGMPRKDWEAERKQRIDKPGKLQVTVDDIKVSISGDTATVRFRQQYTSATLKSTTSKTLTLVKSDNKWLIQQERVG
jgi:tetratricopeptide (TPR) repeat protein